MMRDFTRYSVLRKVRRMDEHALGFLPIVAKDISILGSKTMPMKYDPDTGIPRYVPDIGEELRRA